MALVFQYGSNVSRGRLNAASRLKGRARFLCAVQTQEDYELSFTVWSEGNGCAAADLVPRGSRKIWGALYDIPDEYVYRKQCPDGERDLTP